MRCQYTFTGQYDFAIDSKNRINIPATFRKQLQKSDKNKFVITRGIDHCIWIYPIGEWEKIERELNELSSLSRTNRTFLRNHLRHAKIVSSDEQGRIILTKSLVEYANILKAMAHGASAGRRADRLKQIVEIMKREEIL